MLSPHCMHSSAIMNIHTLLVFHCLTSISGDVVRGCYVWLCNRECGKKNYQQVLAVSQLSYN